MLIDFSADYPKNTGNKRGKTEIRHGTPWMHNLGPHGAPHGIPSEDVVFLSFRFFHSGTVGSWVVDSFINNLACF